MINQFRIKQLLEKLNKNYGRDKKKCLPKTPWEFYQQDTEFLESKGQLDAQELLSLQPSCILSDSSITTGYMEIYDSYEEFDNEWSEYLEDKYRARLNQIITWTIHSNIEDMESDEDAQFALHLGILQPDRNSIKEIIIRITKEDTPKIKRLLRKSAMFNLYNFSQTFN